MSNTLDTVHIFWHNLKYVNTSNTSNTSNTFWAVLSYRVHLVQVKTESQDDSIQLQFELSDASKVGNLPDFSIVWFVWWNLSGTLFYCLICLAAPNPLSVALNCQIVIRQKNTEEISHVWIVVWVTLSLCDLYLTSLQRKMKQGVLEHILFGVQYLREE